MPTVQGEGNIPPSEIRAREIECTTCCRTPARVHTRLPASAQEWKGTLGMSHNCSSVTSVLRGLGCNVLYKRWYCILNTGDLYLSPPQKANAVKKPETKCYHIVQKHYNDPTRSLHTRHVKLVHSKTNRMRERETENNSKLQDLSLHHC